jgi:ribosomal protein S25
MASNIENDYLPDEFLDFFRTNKALAIRKIEDLLMNTAKKILNSHEDNKITNIVLFDYLEDVKEDLQDIWQENVLTEVVLAYKTEFKGSISNKALELSYKNFQKGLEKAYDQIAKQVLRWSLDLISEDILKLAQITIQNLKSTIRKSFKILQDNTIPPSNF